MTASLFRKIPKWCWYVFPVAILIILFFACRDGGRGALRWLRSPQPQPRLPSISPEKGEEIKEEIREEAAAEVKKIEAEQDEIHETAEDWRRRLQ